MTSARKSRPPRVYAGTAKPIGEKPACRYYEMVEWYPIDTLLDHYPQPVARTLLLYSVQRGPCTVRLTETPPWTVVSSGAWTHWTVLMGPGGSNPWPDYAKPPTGPLDHAGPLA